MNTTGIEYQAKLINGKMEFIKIDGEENVKKFKQELQDGEFFQVIYKKGKEWNSWLQMKYYRKCLTFFVPNNFDTANEAHEHFARTYLSEVDVIDLDDEKLSEKIQSIIANAGQGAKPTTKKFIDEDGKTKIEINWVKSTSKLTTKAFSEYINYVITEAAGLGIIILSSEDWKKQNNY